MLLDERGRLPGEDVRHLLILPERSCTARHVSDPADAVDDGLVVTVAWMDFEKIRVPPARRRVAYRLAVAHGDLLAHDAAGRVDVFDRLIGAVLQLRAERGVRAGERAGNAHLDLGLSRPGEGDCRAESQTESRKFLHTHLPL